MEKEFVTYEQALALKELGFDEPGLLIIQYASDYDIFTGNKFQNSIWFGNGYEANIDDKKIKYKFPKDSGVNYGRLKIPLKQQVFRWFRETHGIFIQPNRTIDTQGTWYYFSANTHRTEVFDGSFKYEEAENACIDKLIEILYERINDRNIMDVITTMG